MKNSKFWFVNKDGLTCKINLEILLKQCDLSGFHTYNKALVQVVNNEIHFRDDNFFYDFLKATINGKNQFQEDVAKDRFERDMLSQGRKLITRLRELDKSLILVDEKESAVKFFKNGYLTITSESIILNDYSSLGNKLLWHGKIQDRDWSSETIEDSLFRSFIDNSIGISDYTRLVLGYLTHDFNEEGKGYLVVLTDKTQRRIEGGGTGKNLLCSILELTISKTEVSAEQLKYDSTLMQSWDFQRLFIISDAGAKFNWPFLKNLITGNTQHKKLYQNEEQISYKEMPKFVVSTNHSVPEDDGGLNRRIRILEFSSFYKENGGVDVYHGGMFPLIWSETDYFGYDHFIAECIQLYFINKGQIKEVNISESGNIKRFIGNYGEDLYDFIDTNFEIWLEKGMFTTQEFNSEINKFLNQKSNQKDFSNAKLNNAIESFVVLKNGKEPEFNYAYYKSKKHNNTRYRVFEKKTIGELVTEINHLSSN